MKLVFQIVTKYFVSSLNVNIMDKKGFFVALAKVVVKYILPLLIGWFEGDSHLVEDSISSLF